MAALTQTLSARSPCIMNQSVRHYALKWVVRQWEAYLDRPRSFISVAQVFSETCSKIKASFAVAKARSLTDDSNGSIHPKLRLSQKFSHTPLDYHCY